VVFDKSEVTDKSVAYQLAYDIFDENIEKNHEYTVVRTTLCNANGLYSKIEVRIFNNYIDANDYIVSQESSGNGVDVFAINSENWVEVKFKNWDSSHYITSPQTKVHNFKNDKNFKDAIGAFGCTMWSMEKASVKIYF
jgi:hypothetical protein